MTSLTITMRGDDVAKILRAAAEQAPAVLAKVVNQVAADTRQAMQPVLTTQTALKAKTIHKALKLTSATSSNLTAVVWSAGGNISLKHFAPAESPAGVMAAPWGKRRLYPGTFMKAGRFPDRVEKPNWQGQVFWRPGGKTRTGMDRFKKVKSDEYIPTEMVTGNTAATFTSVSTALLGPAVDRAMAEILGGGK